MRKLIIALTLLALTFAASGCTEKQYVGGNEESIRQSQESAETSGAGKINGDGKADADADKGAGDRAGDGDGAGGSGSEYGGGSGMEEAAANYGGAVTCLEDLKDMENWETAYPYIEALGKPAQDISPDYSRWVPQGAFNGGEYYSDADGDVYYVFPSSFFTSVSGYYAGQLSGKEVCVMVAAPLGLFFPDAEWPEQAEDTAQYLEQFLGIEFEEYDYEGKGYFSSFEDGMEYVDISCEDDGVISPENFVDLCRKM
ncbi:MAG: hypothetical protein FWG53_11450 [Clostridiales bacterium]|nr:hypothetical protein [Clostridiales bacterium]